MSMTNYLGNQVLQQHVVTPGGWLGLHVNDPTAEGFSSTEIVGGGYDRQSVTWSTPSNKTTANTNQLIFLNLPATDVNYFGIWDNSAGGNLLWSFQINKMTFNLGGTFIIPVNDIVVTLP